MIDKNDEFWHFSAKNTNFGQNSQIWKFFQNSAWNIFPKLLKPNGSHKSTCERMDVTTKVSRSSWLKDEKLANTFFSKKGTWKIFFFWVLIAKFQKQARNVVSIGRQRENQNYKANNIVFVEEMLKFCYTEIGQNTNFFLKRRT